MSIRTLLKTCWAAAVLCLAPGSLFALGVGNIQVHSNLNQPLQAEFPLITRDPAELEKAEAGLATREDFSRVDLEFESVLSELKFEIVRKPDGRAVVLVTTDKPIREPFLTFLVEVNWERGRLLREYSILLDPPVRMVTPDPGRVDIRPAAPPPIPPPVTETVEEQAPAPPPEAKPSEPAAPQPAREVATPQPEPATPREYEPEPEPVTPPAPVSYPSSRSGDYNVVRGDTLWRIAHEYRSDTGISINEMMVAILRANPNAFFQDNVNALSAGEILRIPSSDEIRGVGERVAFEAVRAHHQAWQDYRARLGAYPATVVESRVGDVPGTTSTRARTPAARVEVVPARADGGSLSGSPGTETEEDLRQALALTQEQLLTGEQESGELQSRVGDLESQVDKLERLVELKDAELATFQDQLQAADGELPADVLADGNDPLTATEMGLADAAAVDMEMETADAALAEAAKPVVEAGEPPTLTPRPARRGSRAWYSNPLYMAGAGAGVLLLGIAAWVLLARGRTPAFGRGMEPALVGGGSLAARILARSDREEEPEETRDETTSQGSMSGVEVEELSEAVAAFEDETVLQAAVEANPDDPEPRVELLEFYFGTGEREKFQAEAERLFADLGDPLDSRWLKVAELGRQLVPENELFGSPGGEGEDATADKDLEFLEFDLEQELEGTHAGGGERAKPKRAREEPLPSEPGAVGAEAANMEAAFEETQAPEVEPEFLEDTLLAGGLGAGLGDEIEDTTPGDITRDLADAIEKELGLDLESEGLEPEEPDLAAEEAVDEGDAFEALSLGAEAETDADSEEPGPGAEAPASEEFDELPALEFEADSLADIPGKPAKPAAQRPPEPELTAGELDLELMPLEDKHAAKGTEHAGGNGEIELPAYAEEEAGEDDMDVEESVATKLDLARAYMDMGDPESARNMIEEVLSEGNPQQKAEAQSLLGRI
jgi:pilus assembly protein FimV